jgi:subtilase family serine protease
MTIPYTCGYAYAYANLFSDLQLFCARNNLPVPSQDRIIITNLNHSSPPDVTDNITGWFMESCLDLQIAYAMNPNAIIHVVQAISDSADDLFSAIEYTNTSLSSDIVSMSWGTQESTDIINYESYFNKTSTCYLASSGDDSSIVNYPSSSANVLSVGGTTLQLVKNRPIESCWSKAGCGTSQNIIKPFFQDNINILSKKNYRTTPDISALADSRTGIQIAFKGAITTDLFGGTSLSCPLIAGILSISIQDRINRNKLYPLTTVSNSIHINNVFYQNTKALPENNYINDIISGTNGSYKTKKGYDMPTGLGSLNASNMIAYFSSL